MMVEFRYIAYNMFSNRIVKHEQQCSIEVCYDLHSKSSANREETLFKFV